MSTTTTSKRSSGKPSVATAGYLRLIRVHPLLPIEDDEALDRAIALLNDTLDRFRDDPDSQIQGYILVLATLVEAYETERFPEPERNPGSMLLFLIDTKGTSQAQVAAATGLSRATISQIAAGLRKPSRRSIEALAKHFDVEPGLFF